MPQFAIIADDLTGAADAAAPFAMTGQTTYVAVDHDELPDCDVLSLSTGSRHASADEAYAAAFAATKRVGQARWLFKKIDSTLRGQLSAELSAVMAASRRSRALIAPAFPSQSRTTIGGRQFVRGKALEDTPFARDIFSSDLLEIWPLARLIDQSSVLAGPGEIADMLAEEVAGVWVADAERDEDLLALAVGAVAGQIDLFCGSGGLSRALAAVSLLPASGRNPRAGRDGVVLVVAGSRHRATVAQVNALSMRADTLMLAPRPRGGGDRHRLGETARTVVLSNSLDRCSLTSLTQRAGEVSESLSLAGLVVAGGETAGRLVEALGARGIWLCDELEPGIPLGHLAGGAFDGLPIATKAGGFGAIDTLDRMVGALRPDAGER